MPPLSRFCSYCQKRPRILTRYAKLCSSIVQSRYGVLRLIPLLLNKSRTQSCWCKFDGPLQFNFRHSIPKDSNVFWWVAEVFQDHKFSAKLLPHSFLFITIWLYIRNLCNIKLRILLKGNIWMALVTTIINSIDMCAIAELIRMWNAARVC